MSQSISMRVPPLRSQCDLLRSSWTPRLNQGRRARASTRPGCRGRSPCRARPRSSAPSARARPHGRATRRPRRSRAGAPCPSRPPRGCSPRCRTRASSSARRTGPAGRSASPWFRSPARPNRTPRRWGPPRVRLPAPAYPHGALVGAAPPLLEELAAQAGESAALAVAGPGPAMDVIAQADAPGLLGITRWVGQAFPLHASAPGKLILAGLDDAALRDWVRRTKPERFTRRTITGLPGLRAELDRVRAQGYDQLDDQLEPALASLAAELEPAPASLAVAVPPAPGAPRAFLGVSGPSARLDARRRRALVAPMHAIAGA